MQREVIVGLVDVLSGDYVDFTSENLTSGNLEEVMYASFSIPGYFAPVEAFGSAYFDGSAIWDLDISSIVNECLTMVADESDIIIDVVMVTNQTLAWKDTSNWNSIEMLGRYLEVDRYYSTFDNLLRSQFAYPDVNFRYIVGPSSKLPEPRFNNPLVSYLELIINRTSTRPKCRRCSLLVSRMPLTSSLWERLPRSP